MNILTVDKKISFWFLKKKPHFKILDGLAVLIAHYVVFIILAITIIQVGLLSLPILITAWLITLVLEILVKRPRPFQTLRVKPLAKYWVPTYSFPSVHATWSFSGAVLVFLVNPFLGWGVLFLATLVSLSRVYVGVHYLTDVLAGAMVGTIVSLVLSIWLGII